MTYGSSPLGSVPYGGSLGSKIEEIKDKAKTFCQQSKGTPKGELACEISKEVQTWYISDQSSMTEKVKKLVKILKSKLLMIPENMNIYNEIEKIEKEKDLTKQYEIIDTIMTIMPTQIHIGDNISDIRIYGNNNQQIIKGEKDNKNIIVDNNIHKKSWIERINGPATISSFVLVILIEIWNIFFSIYPELYGHIISVIIVISIFLFTSWQNK